MKQLFEGVTMLEGEVGGRPLQLIYLQGEERSILFDCGSAGDPEEFIIPEIKEAGGDPGQLDWIIISHPDFDHTGGIHNMKQVAPDAILACGRLDEEPCTSPQKLIDLRYDVYRKDDWIFYSDDVLDFIKTASGDHQPIETTLSGGETIRLGDDWIIEVVHVPGHSRGHLALWDKKNDALYGADAIHGAVYNGLDGTPKLCPTYLHVEDYLQSIRVIEALPISTYVGCHWSVKKGDEVGAFCAESRNFVEHTDRLISEFFAEPHTLREACLSLGEKLGDWPREVDIELVYAFKGHVSRLVQHNLLSADYAQSEAVVYQTVK